MKKVDLILTSDWHLREDQPICRTDDFWEAQWKVVDQVSALQKKYNCEVIHAGDLFHHWKPSPYLLSTGKQHLPKRFFTVYGQHDLPQHNFELRHKSGINDLEVSKFIEVFEKGHWGMEPAFYCPPMKHSSDYRKIGVIHQFIWDGKKIPWPGCNELTAAQALKKYPKFDLIVTGDHHKPFVHKKGKRLLVNPGCLTRQDASYANHKPRVYLYSSNSNSVEEVLLKVAKNVIDRHHLDKEKARDKRIEAFISRLDNEWDVYLSFEENLDNFLKSNLMRKEVIKLIYKAIES